MMFSDHVMPFHQYHMIPWPCQWHMTLMPAPVLAIAQKVI